MPAFSVLFSTENPGRGLPALAGRGMPGGEAPAVSSSADVVLCLFKVIGHLFKVCIVLLNNLMCYTFGV